MGQVTSRCMERLPDTCAHDSHPTSLLKTSDGEEIRVERAKSNVVVSGREEFARLSMDRVRSTPGLHLASGEASSSPGPYRLSSASSSSPSCPKLIDSLCRIEVSADRVVFNLDLHDKLARRQHLRNYFQLCAEHRRLQVTTSCFAAWRKSKKINGFAKVIPVAQEETDGFASDGPIRVFFFDDNLEWGGCEDSPGICNLRDLATGKFVNFTEGQNGFVQERFARHTVVQHSQMWRVVLVKANILDAIEDKEYFARLISQFSEPRDRLVVFMDVNATIVCNDTVQGKGSAVTLLGTMFELLEFKPEQPFDLQYGTLNQIRVEKVKTLKGLIKDMTADDHEGYTRFWEEKTCWDFLAHVLQSGEVRWVTGTEKMTVESVRNLFMSYLEAVPGALNEDGITRSWFHVYSTKLHDQHSTVLNSFGVDTRKVTLATISEEKDVLHIAINHEMWDERDVRKYADQFQ